MKKILIFLILGIMCVCTLTTYAATTKPLSLSFSAWIPYWKQETAPAAALAHLSLFKEIMPFAYEIGKNGTFVDKMKVDVDPWRTLLETARAKKIKIIPTVAWMDGTAIHAVLSNKKKRTAHIQEIMGIALENEYAGIDVDYEGKKAETRPYFSVFLKELSANLHKNNMTLSCTIESRTPLSSRFKTIPKTVEYANDFKVIASVCDTVRIMAYDQRTIDILLNKSKGKNGALYMPVADKDWVEKVIKEAIKTIPRNKIVLGVPTFGYEWTVADPASTSTHTYTKVRSLNWQDAVNLASSLSITPMRNSAGEMSFSYVSGTSTRLVWYSDAQALNDKIALARSYRLKGVAVFKAEAELDPAVWDILK